MNFLAGIMIHFTLKKTEKDKFFEYTGESHITNKQQS